MKPAIRKIGDPIPIALLIKPDGELVLADGGDVKAYLKRARLNAVAIGDAVEEEPFPVSILPIGVQQEFELAYCLCRTISA